MVAKIKKAYLGSGIYTVSEAALYARVAPQLMARWLFGTTRGNAVIDPQFDPQDRLVSFLDLVQTLAIREIRIQKRVPLVKFRQAIKTAKEYYKLDHPFARQHCTYLMGEELVIRRSPDEPDFIEASGKHRGQVLFQFVETYLEHLDFAEDGLASLYRIFESHDVPITMNPKVRFGEPLLPSGYSAMNVWESITTEGGIAETARVYGIAKEEVDASYRFVVDYLWKAAA